MTDVNRRRVSLLMRYIHTKEKRRRQNWSEETDFRKRQCWIERRTKISYGISSSYWRLVDLLFAFSTGRGSRTIERWHKESTLSTDLEHVRLHPLQQWSSIKKNDHDYSCSVPMAYLVRFLQYCAAISTISACSLVRLQWPMITSDWAAAIIYGRTKRKGYRQLGLCAADEWIVSVCGTHPPRQRIDRKRRRKREEEEGKECRSWWYRH